MRLIPTNLGVVIYRVGLRQFARSLISRTSFVQAKLFSVAGCPRGADKMADGELTKEYGKRAKLVVSSEFIANLTNEWVS